MFITDRMLSLWYTRHWQVGNQFCNCIRDEKNIARLESFQNSFECHIDGHE